MAATALTDRCAAFLATREARYMARAFADTVVVLVSESLVFGPLAP